MRCKCGISGLSVGLVVAAVLLIVLTSLVIYRSLRLRFDVPFKTTNTKNPLLDLT